MKKSRPQKLPNVIQRHLLVTILAMLTTHPCILDHPGHFKFSPLRNVIIVYSHNPVTRFQGAFNTGRGVIKDLYNVHMRAQRGATPNANPDQVGLVLRQRHDPRSHVKQLCDVMWGNVPQIS